MKNSDTGHESFLDKLKHAFSGQPSEFDGEEEYYRKQCATRTSSAKTDSRTFEYSDVRPAYQIGHTAGMATEFEGKTFDDIDTDLRRGWETHAKGSQSWDDVRDYARDAYDRGQSQRLVLSEEQLKVGKRQVQAGEVNLRKEVDTEHVQESVTLVHDEVTIERRPLSGTSASGTEIGEETIRVQLMAEEAVVEKKTVGVEEVVVRKASMTEEKTVEADVRKERLVTDGIDEDGRSTRTDSSRKPQSR